MNHPPSTPLSCQVIRKSKRKSLEGARASGVLASDFVFEPEVVKNTSCNNYTEEDPHCDRKCFLDANEASLALIGPTTSSNIFCRRPPDFRLPTMGLIMHKHACNQGFAQPKMNHFRSPLM